MARKSQALANPPLPRADRQRDVRKPTPIHGASRRPGASATVLQVDALVSGERIMDVFEAVDSRIACRRFLDMPVDPNIVRNLIAGAARAASNGNLQPWHVHAVTGE